MESEIQAVFSADGRFIIEDADNSEEMWISVKEPIEIMP